MKHGKKTFVIIEAVLGILVILVLGFIIYKQNGHEPETIAVIIPDVDESEWSAFKYGLKMAAREYDTDVVIISKDNMETANEEIEIMNQEIAKRSRCGDRKTDCKPGWAAKAKTAGKKCSYNGRGRYISRRTVGLHTIEPDHYHMGADLAQKLLGKLPWKSDREEDWDLFAVCHFRSSDKKKEGICDTLKGSGAEILWSVSKENDSKEKINLQTQRRVDIVMALDNASFVEAGEAAKDNDLYGAVLYGIGNSTEAVYYLDAGWAQCLVAPDEFDAGYESVAELIKKRHNFFYKMKDRQITYTVLTRENLFSEENRNLLFTISR